MNSAAAMTKSSGAALPAFAYPWTPDNGDGSYSNPILYADYSDPDVIRHGDDFFMTASSFNCTPGLPILHSRDLVNWTLVGHALKNVPGGRYTQVQPGCGVWAPSIRFHAGKFWIFFPTPDEGIYMTSAGDPSGDWSEPHLIQAGRGLIDPCPLWDDDGRAYLVHAYANSRAGVKDRLRVRPMTADGSRLIGEGQIVFHNPEKHPTLEGPKFLKKDGWYYILAPAGGVKTGWQTVLRSRNIYGPYEDKVVLEQGSANVNGPHQGALVDLANGDWWFAHFQDAEVYGRIVHLQPVHWLDGWPLMGEDRDGNGVGEPVARCRKPNVGKSVPAAVPQTSDDFDSPRLGFQWQWNANHRDDWFSLTQRPGFLRLIPQPVAKADLAKIPNLLLQKFPAREFEVETALDFSPANDDEECGLVIMGRVYAALAVRRKGGESELLYRTSNKETLLSHVAGETLRLRVEVRDGGNCSFCFAEQGGDFRSVNELLHAQPGEWIGAKVGIYSLKLHDAPGGRTDVDYFRFQPLQRDGS